MAGQTTSAKAGTSGAFDGIHSFHRVFSPKTRGASSVEIQRRQLIELHLENIDGSRTKARSTSLSATIPPIIRCRAHRGRQEFEPARGCAGHCGFWRATPKLDRAGLDPRSGISMNVLEKVESS